VARKAEPRTERRTLALQLAVQVQAQAQAGAVPVAAEVQTADDAVGSHQPLAVVPGAVTPDQAELPVSRYHSQDVAEVLAANVPQVLGAELPRVHGAAEVFVAEGSAPAVEKGLAASRHPPLTAPEARHAE
jgi:hypothetical protein